ncbi:hypothetical protein [Sediminibacterium goheungense]|uniref:Uncharacterized protein n=1 Tax=Sediminibacterium goheungense TaxID=1086393 RepID=A0A4R6J1P9_9BACT|nr:hypothetical protein [Sediminibacterium goheungense]TDO28777.1 hypothetical protein BC659_0857 [Sediminibacterium goheungense]
MTSEERKTALEKEYNIVQATLTYLIGLHGRTIVYDGDDMIGHYYRQEKQKAEKYYQERKRSRLQVQLKKLTKSLESSMDFNYAIFIKEQTGYAIDIFEELTKDIQQLISQDEILSREQWRKAGSMLEFCKRTHADNTTIEKISQLLQAYTQKHLEELTSKTKNQRTEVINRSSLSENIELFEVRISTGPKPKHDKEWVIPSPDQTLKIHINQLAYGKSANTYVNIRFPKADGTLYATRGIHEIEAYWKDNTTVVIRTTSNHETLYAYKKVESFDNIIHIEYHPLNPIHH